MTKLVLWLSIFFLTACGGGGSSPTILPPAVVDSSSTLPDVPVLEKKIVTQNIDGQLVDRPYLIRYPENLSKDKYPVVLFFHGSGGTGESWLADNDDVSTLVDDGKFIGIFPDGYDERWNASNETNADDVDFVSLIINDLDGSGLFDINKIYGVGISNGAGLVNRIAKETTHFKAIAPIISQQTVTIGEIVPSRAVSVFQVNGIEDDVIPVNGGSGVAGSVFMSAQASAENWALNFNCNMTPTIQNKDWESQAVKQYTFGSCIDKQKVRYSLVEGAGHSADFGENVDLYGVIWSFFTSTDADLPARNVKILSLGDSYTIGESVCNTCSFPEQLKSSLEVEYSEQDVVSLEVIAKTGWTTSNLKNAIISEAPSNDFDLVTLLIGVNNQYQSKPFSVYETEFIELVNSAISFVGDDATKLIIVSIPDYAYTPYGQNGNALAVSADIDRYNSFAADYAEENGLTYVYITDITREGLDDPNLVALDGLHPSGLAYAKFVERILPLALAKVE
ncbi:MAG: acyl-CoA thioesterase-1 [Porticoccaceae bacterium]|jgi:acyl-CoA thioesterase-1